MNWEAFFRLTAQLNAEYEEKREHDKLKTKEDKWSSRERKKAASESFEEKRDKQSSLGRKERSKRSLRRKKKKDRRNLTSKNKNVLHLTKTGTITVFVGWIVRML